jgi:hypothetical protein
VLDSFSPYVRELEKLAGAGPGRPFEDLSIHLDGEANRQLRSVVPISELRRLGAFFTGEALARKLLATVPVAAERYTDPACGCGDLLLAASDRFEVLDSLEDTLRSWNERLCGRDLIPEFVRAARARLVLAAITRGARPTEGHPRPMELLSSIAVGNGLDLDHEPATAVVVNPPYGLVRAPAPCEWSSGATTAAAVFIDSLLSTCAEGVYIAAVLPEVLRSGSRYRRFRETVARRIRIDLVGRAGVFDALTDVDVFILAGRASASAQDSSMSWTVETPSSRLEEIADIRVGAVVANRDPHLGAWHLYLDARDLGGASEYRPVRHRRFRGSVLKPPFVVVGRTNRPREDHGPRLRPALVVGEGSVAVENHLIAITPHAQTLTGCREVAKILKSARASRFLDERLRCRHLTVGAVGEIPR